MDRAPPLQRVERDYAPLIIVPFEAGHTHFWTSDAIRAELGEDFELSDSSLVVLEQFVLAC